MTRYRVDIAYDGTAFHGWATQPGLRTVQEELETWIARVMRLPHQPLLLCAGRTDAGVHARGQVAHLDLDLPDPALVAEKLAHKLRIALPQDVAVRSVKVALQGSTPASQRSGGVTPTASPTATSTRWTAWTPL